MNSIFELYVIYEGNYLCIYVRNIKDKDIYSKVITKDKLELGVFDNIDSLYNCLRMYMEGNEGKDVSLRYTNSNNNNDVVLCFHNVNHNDLCFTLHKSHYMNTTIGQLNNNNNVSTLRSHYSTLFNLINPTIIINILPFISITLLSLLFYLLYQYLYPYLHYPTSSIISSVDMNTISHWINPSLIYTFTLLYKASEDGDDVKTFHNLCDNMGSTVTLILTEDNWIFGGYTDVEWESDDDPSYWSYRHSNQSFLFSITLHKKYPIVLKDKAIFCSSMNGPTFGYGFDFALSNKFLTKESTCNAPFSYENMKGNNEFNGGKKMFIAKEVEVFRIEKK